MFFTGNGKENCGASENDAEASCEGHEWGDINEEFRDDATKTMALHQVRKGDKGPSSLRGVCEPTVARRLDFKEPSSLMQVRLGSWPTGILPIEDEGHDKLEACRPSQARNLTSDDQRARCPLAPQPRWLCYYGERI